MEIKNTAPYVGESVRSAPVVKAVGDQHTTVDSAKEPNQIADRKIAVEESDNTPLLQGQDVQKALADVNRFFQAERRNLSFSINEKTRDVVIEVKDAETDEVIRQIPPEFVIKLAENLHELSGEDPLGGLLLKDKA